MFPCEEVYGQPARVGLTSLSLPAEDISLVTTEDYLEAVIKGEFNKYPLGKACQDSLPNHVQWSEFQPSFPGSLNAQTVNQTTYRSTKEYSATRAS